MVCVNFFFIFFFVHEVLSAAPLPKIKSNIKTKGNDKNKGNGKGDLRVINGFDDKDNKYLYVVAFGDKDHFSRLCTGSLIAAEWVITAAHCFASPDNPNLKVQYGDLTVATNSTEAKFSNVLKILTHSSFSRAKLYSDIAMAYVETVTLNTYARLSAVDYLSTIGLSVIYVGVGTTKQLKDLDEKVIEADGTRPRQYGEAVVTRCVKNKNTPNPSPALCLASKCSAKTQSIYFADSGGPLLFSNKIIGVGCCVTHLNEDIVLSVYTPISPFLNWISNNLDSARRGFDYELHSI